MISKEHTSNESLCEKSMLLVANLIKLSSSISFTKTPNNQPSFAGSRAPPLTPGSRRLQEPQSRLKPIYLTKPSEADFQIGHESPRYSSSVSSPSNVDGWASEFIEKVHKNRKISDESTMKKPYLIAKTRLRRSSSVLE